MLGQSEFGLYSLAISVIAYLTVLDFGFANAIVRYTAKYRAEGKTEEQYEMFGMFFLLYCAISIVAFAIAWGVMMKVDWFFGENMTPEEVSRLKLILVLMAFNLAFTFPMSVWGAIINAYERFVFQKSINLIRTILNPLVMVFLLLYGYKAVALVVLTTIFNVLTLVINYFYCVKSIGIKLRFKKFKIPFLKEVSLYSFWIFLNAVTEQFYWSSGQLILGVTCGTAAVAVFAIAMQLRTMYYQFSTALSSVFLPKVTIMVTKGASNKEVSNLFIKTGRIQYIIMAYTLVGFILFGKQFISLWAGPDYEESYIITLIVFVATFTPLIQNLGITILQARNQLKFRSLLIISASALSLVIAIPFSMWWGALGCAIATGVCVLTAYGIILNIYYKKKILLDIGRFWKSILRMSIIPILFLLIGIFALSHVVTDTWLSLFVAIAVFSILYIPTFFCLSMNSYERSLFLSPFRKVLNRLPFQK